MPAKNIIKTYIEEGYYHIYNRGVEKRPIFLEEQDCKVFLHYLKLYLSPIEQLEKMAAMPRFLSFLSLNLSKEIDLLSFALMPNHIHMQVKQHTKDGITKLMRRLITSYVMYFNRKYKRVGALFQNKYKAAFVDNDNYLLYLSAYIHRNPFHLSTSSKFRDYSSYSYYLGQKQASWIKPQEIISSFSQTNSHLSYQAFVEGETDEDIKAFLPEDILPEDED